MLELQFNKNKFNKVELERLESQFKQNLKCSIDLDFDVLRFKSGSTDIYAHVLAILSRLEIHKTLDISESELLDFIIDVSHLYHKVPYHNFHHAADIVTVLYYFCQNHVAGKHLSKMEIALLLIAGLCHDIGHPGLNNAFQKNSKSQLGQRYDKTESILESYSVDLTFELLDKYRIKSGHVAFKDSLRDLILYTDMVSHSELENQVKTLTNTLPTWKEEKNRKQTIHSSKTVLKDQQKQQRFKSSDVVHSELNGYHVQNELPEKEQTGNVIDDDSNSSSSKEINNLSLCRIILHAADISNMSRPWTISKQWSDLIVQEFFNQGDKERSKEMTISPGMDRETCSQQVMSLKFGEGILPFFESLVDLLPSVQVLVKHLAANRIEWKNYVPPRNSDKPATLPLVEKTNITSVVEGGRRKRHLSCDLSLLSSSDPSFVSLPCRRLKHTCFELHRSSYPAIPIYPKPQYRHSLPPIEFKPSLEVTTTVDTHVVLYHPHD